MTSLAHPTAAAGAPLAPPLGRRPSGARRPRRASSVSPSARRPPHTSTVHTRAGLNPFSFLPPPLPDLSGELLSAAATFALQTNLRSATSIDAAVDCTVPGLLTGQVDGVVITGREWVSRKNLTCSSLRFKVGTVAIDQTALIAERVVKLKSVPTGDADMVFTAEDFGNFLVHPLMAGRCKSTAPP